MNKKRYLVDEYDTKTRRQTKTYVLEHDNAAETKPKLSQLSSSTLTASNTIPSHYHMSLVLKHYALGVITYLKTLFLPIGYPDSVTSDYTPYQIYDSLQAFASSIAGLLASRAVLQSLDLVSESDSTSAATAATVLAVVQNTLSNITTILFASHAAPRISADVKYYRFLADVVNDSAFVLDLLAPSLPRTSILSWLVNTPVPGKVANIAPSVRVVALCISSMLRAVCGVAGGSSKAVLSSHFARNNPESVGDLNAKDSSQETVIGLLGMWAGGIVVSRVEGMYATWLWMTGLLTLHLWTNWCAVKSVRLRHLNRERAGLVLGRMVNSRNCQVTDVDLERIGADETVLGISLLFQNLTARAFGKTRQTWRAWRIGASAEELIRALDDGSKFPSTNKTPNATKTETLMELLSVFEGLKYVICIGSGKGQVTIAFRPDAKPIDQLRAMHHAFLLDRHRAQQTSGRLSLTQYRTCENNQQTVSSLWEVAATTLEHGGWDLASTQLTDGNNVGIDIREVSA